MQDPGQILPVYRRTAVGMAAVRRFFARMVVHMKDVGRQTDARCAGRGNKSSLPDCVWEDAKSNKSVRRIRYGLKKGKKHIIIEE